MKDQQPKAELHLQVETNIEALKQVEEWLQNIVLPLLPEDLWWQCSLIFNEGFTNAVRHAHKNLDSTIPIDLEVTVFPTYLEIRIWDRGQPFDLEAKLQSIIEDPRDPLEKEGGRGLLFMHKLTEELRYIRADDRRNCLVMRKNIT
jgi:serine/threonine-protein kinase RsbW